MLSLSELQRAAGILQQDLAGSLVQRIVQIGEFCLVWTWYGAGATRNLLFDCSPEFARVCYATDLPPASAVPPPFVQYLRAHLGRAQLVACETAEADRRLTLAMRAREGRFRLIFSIMGSRSNIYLLDDRGTLLFAMRRLETTRKELSIGAPWVEPEGELRSAGIDRWRGTPDSAYLETVQEAYRQLERVREFEEAGRRIGQALKREAAYLSRKAGNLAEDLGEASRVEEFRRKGELLKSALHRIRPGDPSVAVEDLEAGTELVIPLDPALTPAANLEAYFRRYRKGRRGAEAIGRQLGEVAAASAEVARLEEELRDILAEGTAAGESLQSLARQPLVRRLLGRRAGTREAARPPGSPRRSQGEIPSRLLPRRFRGEHGLEIWVGRSDEGNDHLTRRLARGSDLFFHLEGYPGSHVILRTEGKSSPPPEAILDACGAAVHYSRLKEAPSADVHVVPVKNVRKPKGARRGTVYVTGGKTVRLRRDRRRLESILASRLEE